MTKHKEEKWENLRPPHLLQFSLQLGQSSLVVGFIVVRFGPGIWVRNFEDLRSPRLGYGLKWG